MNLMQDGRAIQIVAPDKDWWRGAVIYQIYPRSFQDSNGDGIGDLAGIIHRLPTSPNLAWTRSGSAPFFRSPMLDFGYDVSDYRDVDPMFGTLGDFDALIHRAHELGLKVMIDLVLSHTSNQHAWFQESRSSRDNPKSDWYVWADAKPDGSRPTTGCRSSAARPGNGIGRPDAVLPAQLPEGAARPEPAQSRRAGRTARPSRASGWIAGSTGSASTRSTSTSTTRSCATTRRWRRKSATPPSRRR
jgi:hypothetical protein